MISNSKLFLCVLFIVSPFIDAINGYLVLNGFSSEGGSGSIGQIFRFILMMYTIYFVGLTSGMIILTGVSLLFFSIEVFFAIFHQNMPGLLVGVVYASKIIFVLLMYLAFKKVLNSHNLMYIIKFFIISSCIYSSILIVTTLLGVSTSTYYSGMGSKGFFASGNGLSLYLGASSLVALYYFRGKYFNLVPLFLILSCLLVGTKASLVFLFLFFFIIFFDLSYYAKIPIIIIVLFLVAFNFDYLLELFNDVFEVIVNRFNNSKSVFQFLASGRDQILSSALLEYNVDGINAIRVITGYGVFTSYRSPFSISTGFDTLESEFLDIFFMYGVLGLLFYLYFFIKSLLYPICSGNLTLALSVLGVFGYSFIAGHVLFNAMSSIVLCLVVFISFNSKNTSVN